MSTVNTATEIRTFSIDTPEGLTELRRRIAATRWPSKELVPDASQGVQLATLKSAHATGRPSTTGGRPRQS